MLLPIQSRVEGELAFLHLEGSLTLGPTLQTLRDTVKQVLANHPVRGLILEMDQLNAVDSAGLGELTVVYTLCSRQRCQVVLSSPSANLKAMLEITHLDGLLPCVPSAAAARSFLTTASA